jgi:Fe-S cluster assembly protein SufD
MQAWKAWIETPLPGTTDEPWRRTDLRGLPADQFERKPVDEMALPAEVRPPGEAGATLILRPGLTPELQLSPELREQGVIFTDWATAVSEHADLLKQHLGQTVKDDEGKFAALAAALAVDGVLIYIPNGVALEEPLQVLVWAPGDGLALLTRTLIVVEQGASASIVHETASPAGENPAMHAGIVEVSVGPGARLAFSEIQNLGDQVWNFTHERMRVSRDAYADWVFGSNGSRLTKNFSELSLEGEGAEGRWSGIYFADGSQHLDHDTQQNHLAANTTSDLLFKGALTDRSRSVWQGMIYVAPGAQRTDGYQANRNLILSKKARADSIPGLEILADDVRCTHGATVSQLEQEPIFYLMSRGIPRPQAERLVVEGFFDSVLRRIENEWVRKRFEMMIDIKLRSRV